MRKEHAMYVASKAQTGWLVFFSRLTLRQAWARTLAAPHGGRLGAFRRALFCWCSNLAIALAQLASNPGAWRDGMWQLVHVGIVIVEDERRYLLEATTPTVRLTELAPLLETDLRHAHLLPYRGIPAIEGFEELRTWAVDMIGLRYDHAGLFGVLTNLGINSPDGLFCSEISAWGHQILDLLPERSRRIVGGRMLTAILPPGFWSPSELARERGALTWTHAIEMEGA